MPIDRASPHAACQLIVGHRLLAAVADAGGGKDLHHVGAVGLELTHLLADLVGCPAPLVQLADGGEDARPRQDAAGDCLAQLHVVGRPRALDGGEAGEQRHVRVLGGVKNFLRRCTRLSGVAPVAIEVPSDVRVHVDHPGQHRDLSEIVCGVGRRPGFDRGDFGSLHHHGRVPQRPARAVEDGRRVDSDDRTLLRHQRRGGQKDGKQSGVESHGAHYNLPTHKSLTREGSL